MKVTVEKGENQQVTLTVEVEAAEVSKAVEKAVKRLSNRVNIPGFRKGKAPRKIIERNVGMDAIMQEAFDIVGPKAFADALEEQKIEPVSRPQIDIETLEDGKDLVFKATVTPRPEGKLGEYKGLKVEKNVEAVTDEDVEKQLKTFQDRQGKMVDAPEGSAVKDGDFTTLDFEGFVDGEAFEGGKGQDYPLQIGSGSFIPGFEDQLIGAKIGEEKEVNVTFPEEYHAKELAGKAATFKCTIRSIKQKELPAMDDELAKKVSKFETLEELKADVRKNLEENAARKAENDQKAAAIDMATSNITVDIPAVMIDNRVEGMIREMAMRLEQQGMSFDAYLQLKRTFARISCWKKLLRLKTSRLKQKTSMLKLLAWLLLTVQRRSRFRRLLRSRDALAIWLLRYFARRRHSSSSTALLNFSLYMGVYQ